MMRYGWCLQCWLIRTLAVVRFAPRDDLPAGDCVSCAAKAEERRVA
jgi:hypothetical protein